MSGDLELLKDMGFPEVRVRKALRATGNAGLQPALDWLESHQNDVDIDEEDTAATTTSNTLALPPGTSTTTALGNIDTDETAGDAAANSLKCDDCGKLLRNTDSATLHASRAGHQNFSQSTEVIKPLTEEEKKQKLEELKAKLAAKRAEKAEAEKMEQKDKEKLRRITGKDITKAKEEQKEKDMKAAFEQKKKEQKEDLAAKKRIKDQIEADKKARAEKLAEEKRLREGRPLESPSMKPAQVKQVETPKGDFQEARIQVRAPGRPPITKTFAATDKFEVLVNSLKAEGFEGNLMMTYPRKSFTSSDYQKTFKELGLCPSVALALQ